jgi:hypothetical protein
MPVYILTAIIWVFIKFQWYNNDFPSGKLANATTTGRQLNYHLANGRRQAHLRVGIASIHTPSFAATESNL